MRRWKRHRNVVRTLVFTSDGRLVSGSFDGFVKMWDAETGAKVWSRNAGIGQASCVSELADGRLVVGGWDGSVRVLNGVTGDEIIVCRGHTRLVNAAISLGDLNAGSFASGSYDDTIRVWASDGTLVRAVEVGKRALSLSLTPCGQFVAVGCGGGSVKLFRLPDWDQVWSVEAHGGTVLSVSWSPDGRFLASGSDDAMVVILSADTGATLRTLRDHTSVVYSVLFSQDGTKVLSGSSDKTVRVWRLFRPMERKARGLMGGVDVHVEDWEMKEVCCEIVGRMKRLWEVEAE